MNPLFRLKGFRLFVICMLLASSLEAAEYYVVIGTFADESNARALASTVRKSFKDASYSYNDARHLYYVHVMKTSRKEEATNWSLYLKEEKGFKDAWVFASATSGAFDSSGDNNPENESRAVSGPAIASSATEGKFLSYEAIASADASVRKTAWTSKSGVSFIEDISNPMAMQSRLAEEAGQLFTFVVENSEGKEMPSEVMLVDFAKIKILTSFQTGEHAAIRGTRRGQMITFVCDVLGYAQETRMYNIDHLSRGRDIQKNEAGIWEVRFKLKKMELNDIAIMNKTFFYKDAALLKPSSEGQLQELVAIMQSNPGYEIVIHSHCNPAGKREVRLPENTDNYFDMSQSYLKRTSDKRLTKERARVVRNYLVAHGINRKRIDVIGWGSLELIAKPTGPDADRNERAEIELVER